MEIGLPGQRHGSASEISDLGFGGSAGDQVGVRGSARLNSNTEL